MSSAINFNIGADNTAFISTLKKTQAAGSRAANRIQGSFDKLELGKTVTGLLTVGSAAAALYTVADGLKGVTDYAGRMSDLSSRTGLGVKQTIMLSQAFKNAGLESGAVGASINKLQKALAGANEDGAPTAEIFKKLGLNVYALQAMDPAQQFETVGNAISGLAGDSAKAAAAMAIFGKSGGELLAIFKDAEAFKIAREQVGKLGDEIEKNASTFDKFSDAVGSLELKKMQLFAGIASGISGDLETAADWLNKLDLVGVGQQIVQPVRGAAATASAAKEGNMKPLTEVAMAGTMPATLGPLGVPIAIYRALKRTGEIGAESQAISKSDAAAFAQEAQARSYDQPRPQTGAFAALAAALASAPEPLRASSSIARAGFSPGIDKKFAAASLRANIATRIPSIALRGIASSTIVPKTNIGRFNDLQSGPSAFQRLQSGPRGSTSLLASHQFGLKTADELGYSPGSRPGSFRIPTKADQVAAAKAAQAKKESLVGTNESLGEILTVLKETLK